MELRHDVRNHVGRLDDFLKVRETLTRIGVVHVGQHLVQSCHILHKQGKYFIVHLKSCSC